MCGIGRREDASTFAKAAADKMVDWEMMGIILDALPGPALAGSPACGTGLQICRADGPFNMGDAAAPPYPR